MTKLEAAEIIQNRIDSTLFKYDNQLEEALKVAVKDLKSENKQMKEARRYKRKYLEEREFVEFLNHAFTSTQISTLRLKFEDRKKNKINTKEG